MDPLAFSGVFSPVCFGILYGLIIGRVLLFLISAVEQISQAWNNRRAKLAASSKAALQRHLPAASPAVFAAAGRETGRLARV